MRPHRRQPTRLPRPWDSPGKNTGVGCHFLLQCMKVKSESEVAQLCPTLRDPMDCSLPAYQPPLSTGFSRQEYWSGVPFGSSQCKSSCNLCLLSVKAKNRGVQMLLAALLPSPVGGSHPEDSQGSPGSSRSKWSRFRQIWVQSLALTLCLLTVVTSVVTEPL